MSIVHVIYLTKIKFGEYTTDLLGIVHPAKPCATFPMMQHTTVLEYNASKGTVIYGTT